MLWLTVYRYKGNLVPCCPRPNPARCDLAKLGHLKNKRNNYLRELVQIVLILVSVPP